MELCKCGCGKEVTKEGNDYLIGHYTKGKKVPRSEESKRKQSESMKGEKNHFYGKHHTEESKQIIIDKKTGYHYSEEHRIRTIEALKGNKYRWQGGNASYWAKEMKKVYKRCVLCKSIIKLEMHHKDKDQENNERSNRIILCKTCHNFWHNN